MAPAAPQVATRPAALDVHVRSALAFVTFAAVAFSLGQVTTLVSSFRWSTSMLGSALSYGYAAPTAVGWLFLVIALLNVATLAREGDARRGVHVVLTGALLSLSAAAVAVAATALQSRSHATEIVLLTKVSVGLQAVGLLVLAMGILVVRGRLAAQGRTTWLPVLRLIGVGLALAAIEPAYELFVKVVTSVVPAELLSNVVSNGSMVASWALLAWAAALAAPALRRHGRTSTLALGAPLVSGGAVLLALSFGAVLAFTELVARGIDPAWQSRLTEIAPTLAWAGWLGVAVGFGLAAMRLTDTWA